LKVQQYTKEYTSIVLAGSADISLRDKKGKAALPYLAT